jgi:hypothetical protein
MYKTNPKKFYIIRTYSAGVFFGNIKELKGTEVIVTNCRRLWSWSGAASLTQLAIDGTTNPNGCKFTMTVKEEDGVYLPQAVEVIPCSEKAVESINSVIEWKI